MVPVPGKTKTRLTHSRGDPLSEDEADRIYEAMLMDTVNLALAGLRSCEEKRAYNSYDLFFGYEPVDRKSDLLKLLSRLGLDERGIGDIGFFPTIGEKFDDRMELCFNIVFRKGYDAAAAIGGDHPSFQPDFIEEAFFKLEDLNHANGAMVVSPSLEAGTSLYRMTKEVPVDLSGVFYNPDGITALEAFADKAIKGSIPLAMLELISDVDIPSDLASMIVLLKLISYSSRFNPDIVVPENTIRVISELGLVAQADSGERDIRTK